MELNKLLRYLVIFGVILSLLLIAQQRLGITLETVRGILRHTNTSKKVVLSLNNPKQVSFNETSIPKIIHQMWDTYRVPDQFIPWIKTVVEKHPSWQYWFWTQGDARCLLRKFFPDYVDMYRNYVGPIFKSDAIRYFILYQFGGIYMDLDFEVLRPLDDLIEDTDCFLSTESYGWYFVMNRKSPIVMNGIMGCKPKHVFFKSAFKMLPERQIQFPLQWIRATGPLLLDSVWRNYTNTKESIQEPISVLSSKYFLSTVSYETKIRIKEKCGHYDSSDDMLFKVLCTHARLSMDQDKEAYAKHYWTHSQTKSHAFKLKHVTSIYDILANVHRPKDILGC